MLPAQGSMVTEEYAVMVLFIGVCLLPGCFGCHSMSIYGSRFVLMLAIIAIPRKNVACFKLNSNFVLQTFAFCWGVLKMLWLNEIIFCLKKK